MRSRADRRPARHLAALVVAAAALGPSRPAAAQAAPPAPTVAQVEAAASALKAHPDVAGTETIHRMRWKSEDRPRTETRSEWTWLRDFARWISETSRWLAWALGAVLAAVVLVAARRWARERADAAAAAQVALPARVRDLDIRPESLPDDVGGAALALWRRGEPRAALALLYRATLSRLVHRHAVPITAASTEGECMHLAQARLAAPDAGYVVRLVRCWQAAVYGHRPPPPDEFEALCAAFDARLGAARPAGPAPEPAR